MADEARARLRSLGAPSKVGHAVGFPEGVYHKLAVCSSCVRDQGRRIVGMSNAIIPIALMRILENNDLDTDGQGGLPL